MSSLHGPSAQEPVQQMKECTVHEQKGVKLDTLVQKQLRLKVEADQSIAGT